MAGRSSISKNNSNSSGRRIFGGRGIAVPPIRPKHGRSNDRFLLRRRRWRRSSRRRRLPEEEEEEQYEDATESSADSAVASLEEEEEEEGAGAEFGAVVAVAGATGFNLPPAGASGEDEEETDDDEEEEEAASGVSYAMPLALRPRRKQQHQHPSSLKRRMEEDLSFEGAAPSDGTAPVMKYRRHDDDCGGGGSLFDENRAPCGSDSGTDLSRTAQRDLFGAGGGGGGATTGGLALPRRRRRRRSPNDDDDVGSFFDDFPPPGSSSSFMNVRDYWALCYDGQLERPPISRSFSAQRPPPGKGWYVFRSLFVLFLLIDEHYLTMILSRLFGSFCVF